MSRQKQIPLCTVNDCARPGVSIANGARVCLAHYKRWKRHGDVNHTSRSYSPPRPVKRQCAAESCAAVEDGSCGYCKKHMTRIRRHGDPNVVIRPEDRQVRRGVDSPHWTGMEATYYAVHQRLRKVRGSAKTHACADCGSRASHWSYVRGSDDERTSDQGPYSVDLSRYEPRCVPCHKVFDLKAIAS